MSAPRGWAGRRRWNKMGNKPTVASDGKMRQSKKEAQHANRLLAAQEGGTIAEYESQRTYELAVYGNAEIEALLCEVEVGCDAELLRFAMRVRQSRQHICKYKADHVFRERGKKHLTVADTKGRTAGAEWNTFLIKKHLMLACHGVDVEVWT
jgi:hypothetical protein